MCATPGDALVRLGDDDAVYRGVHFIAGKKLLRESGSRLDPFPLIIPRSADERGDGNQDEERKGRKNERQIHGAKEKMLGTLRLFGRASDNRAEVWFQTRSLRERFDLGPDLGSSSCVSFSAFQSAEVLADVGRFIEHLRPKPEIRHELDFRADIRGSEIVLSEVRPQWDDREKIMVSEFAKIKWVKSRGVWRLYWMRASGRWESYDPSPSFRTLRAAFDVVAEDKHGCFFG